MATTLYYRDTTAALTISGYVVKDMATTRGGGVVTKTDNSSTSLIIAVTNPTTPICFAYRVAAVTTTNNNLSYNHWGSESNAMANFGAGAQEPNNACGCQIYTNAGTYVAALSSAGTADGPSAEYGTVAGAMTFTKLAAIRSIANGDWIVVFPVHYSPGSPTAGYTCTFSYNGASAAADGDSFITLFDAITAYTPPAGGVDSFPVVGAGYYP